MGLPWRADCTYQCKREGASHVGKTAELSRVAEELKEFSMSQRLLTALFVGSLALASAANAATITYNATGGTSGTDTATSASAVFTTSAGQISIVLSNTLAASAFRDVGQAVSDLSFTLSNTVGTSGVISASGQQGTISGANPPSGGVTVTYTGGAPGRFIGIGGG